MDQQVQKTRALLAGLVFGLFMGLGALAFVFVRARHLRSQASDTAAEEVPVQPGISIVTSATIPAHFSEDLLVPGHTETGTEIAEQDATTGRSDEGV